MCGTNAGSQLMLVNGADVGIETGGSGGGVWLFVNAGNYANEASNFAIAEVVVWPRGLTAEEMRGASEFLINRIGMRVYTLMNEALSWSDANTACLAAGLQFASVHSEAENALLVTAAAGNSVWIGGTDKDSEDTWTWSPSGTPLLYTNWAVGQPDNYRNNQDCLAFNYRSPGLWDDATCTLEKKYVCQNAA